MDVSYTQLFLTIPQYLTLYAWLFKVGVFKVGV